MFQSEKFLPRALVARLTDLRVREPDRPRHVAQSRRRRKVLAPDGRLNLLAADHPARRVTRVGQDPLAMADRGDYLARIVRVLLSDAVDGVMASLELLEELLLLHDLVREAGGPAFLDEKLLVASLNRGGLAGSCWELDDPLTGPAPEACAALKLDGVKVLMRVCDEDPASLRTLEACAELTRRSQALGLPMFLEPLPVERTAQGLRVIQEAGALARLVGVAAALGDGAGRLWLKLPYCEHYEVVARATTLPILLLGGEAAGDPRPFLEQIASGLAAGPNVRGTLVGRNVLYPGEQDPSAVAAAVHGLVHAGWSVERALREMGERPEENLDSLER